MTTEEAPDRPHEREPDLWYHVALRTALVAALFSVLVLGLMVANLIRARSADPLDPARIETLKADLLKHPDDARLKARIRQLDLGLRRDYLRSRRFAMQGLYLLIGGLALCLGALHLVGRYRRRTPVPRPNSGLDPLVAAAMRRRSLAALGMLLGGILITTAVMARHDSTAAYVIAAQSMGPDDRLAGEQEARSESTPLPTGDVQQPPPADSPANPPASVLPRVDPGEGLGPPEDAGSDSEPPPRPEHSNDDAGEPTPEPAGNGDPDETSRPPDPEATGPTDTNYPTPQEFGRNSPRFRGPGGAGVTTAYPAPTPEAQYPRHWDGTTGEGILWQAEIPLPGKSSPIVWNGRVFCTGATQERREVYCLDAATGELLWHKPVSNELSAEDEPPEIAEDTGYAAPTMATDGARVFAIFASGDVGAFDFQGKQLWTRSMGRPENIYGHASSLLTYPGLLIIQLDQGSEAEEGLSALVALDAATGKRVWETPRPVPNSWSSPILIEHSGRKQIVTAADPWVISYDPATGKELWRASCLSGDVAPSPIYAGGLVMVCQDGSDLTAIRPDGTGDVTKTHIAWQAFGNMPEAVSPISDGRLVYVVTGWGMLTCFGASKGEQLWEQDLGASFFSSPALVGDLVYLMDADGVMHIFRSASEYQQVGTAPLGEPTDSSPAFVGGRIYLRGERHLFCIGGGAGTEE